MPTATIRPNATRSRTGLPSPYDSATDLTGVTATVIGDNNDATLVNTPNNNAAFLASMWDTPNPSWVSNTTIESVTVYCRARYTATTSFVFAPESTARSCFVYPIFATNANFYGNNYVLDGPRTKLLLKDTFSTFNLGTLTQRDIVGNKFTKADIDAMSFLVTTSSETPTTANYQVHISDIWMVVTYSQPGVLSGTTATINNTTTPDYFFSWTHPETEYIGAYEAKLFPYSETIKPGFDWQTSTKYVWQSGLVSTGSNMLLSLTLRPDYVQTNGTKYAMYARAVPKSSSIAWSNTATTTRTIDIRSSIAPRLVATKDETKKRISLGIFREDNLLNDDQSLFTTALAGWALLAGSPTVARVSSTGYPSISKFVMQISYTGSSAYDVAVGVDAAHAYANTGATAPFVAIPGEWHSFACRFWTIGTLGTEFRNLRMEVHWYDAANTLISTATGNLFRTIGGTWIYPSVTAKAPPTAVKWAVVMKFTGATGGSEFHLADCMDVHIGNVNVLENPTFERDTDGDNFPDSWTQYSSGAGTTAVATLIENDEAVFNGERCLKISKPTTGQKTEDGIRQTIYFAKSSINTATAYFYSLSAAIVRIYQTGATGTTFTEVTLVPGVITPVAITATQSASTQTTTVDIAVRSGWSGGDVFVSFAHAEPKPVDNSVSLGTVPTTIGKDRLSNFSPGGITLVNSELQYSIDRGLTWQTVFDQPDTGYTPQTAPANIATKKMTQYDGWTWYDYMQPVNTEVWYRARQFFQTVDSITGTILTISSQWSKIARGLKLDAIVRGAWLKSSSDPTLNRFLAITDSRIDKGVQKTRTTLYPLNSTKAIVRSGAKRALSIPFSYYCKTETNKVDVRNLLDSDETLFLTMPKFSAFVNLNGDYLETEFVTVDTIDTDDTVISGTYQEVRAPIQ